MYRRRRMMRNTTTDAGAGAGLPGVAAHALDVRPQRTRRLAMPTIAVPAPAPNSGRRARAGRLTAAQDVVFVVPDRLGRQQVVELVAVRCFLGPFAHCLKHFALDLNPLVARCRVMEGTQYVVDHLVHGHAGVLPGEHDTAVISSGASCVS